MIVNPNEPKPSQLDQWDRTVPVWIPFRAQPQGRQNADTGSAGRRLAPPPAAAPLDAPSGAGQRRRDRVPGFGAGIRR
ncbi:hypothetical protein [Burkholderia glumae]|uniref:hypothetical protein n=1 Tax=Burkholderia glumae TaxID=337 RepID=UPI0002EBAE51|nr:hypothetical protein [Burkholderia glumae]PJO20520.1 hypothetical protein Y5A_024515 [Burkholderia glumae AU6208]QHE12396.1 hypothetical protein GQR88_18580 [Burkholderia glumae AU6208]